MPIDPDELSQDFKTFDEQTTLQQVLDQVDVSTQRRTLIVVRLASGQYVVVPLSELLNTLDTLSGFDKTSMLSAALADLLAPLAADAVDQAGVSRWEIDDLLRQAPGGRLVVLGEDGQIAGVLTEPEVTYRSAPSLGGDPWSKGGMTLSVEDEAPPGAPPGAGPPGTETEKRWLNVELEDRNGQRQDPETKPLQMNQLYTLIFDVDVEVRETSLVTDAFFQYKFKEGEQMAGITVQLESDDFEILTDPQTLRVPRSGRSENRVRFDVKPGKEGPAVINAILLKDGNFVQLLTLKFTVVGEDGKLFSRADLGRPMEAAFVVKPRDLNLTILNTGAGFQVIMTGAVGATATLPLTLPELDQIIAEARQELLNIVHLKVGPKEELVYQWGLDIPPEVNQQTLQTLAKVGFMLFRRIFLSRAADEQAKNLARRLQELARREQLKVQIFSQQFMLPWGILYVADKYDPDNVEPELFLGLKHIIEHIPLQPRMQVLDNRIDNRQGLAVSLNVNVDIDRQMRTPLVENQLNYWATIGRRGGVQVIERKTKDQVLQALDDVTTPDQVAYFYCHAISKSLAETGGPSDSMLVLSGGERLTLEDLGLFTSPENYLQGAPLIFINACESAELSPMFYDGFVPYFMEKGARGVIGTECETPALFAIEWAERFFNRFLSGEPLGQIFLNLRREFFYEHHNVLGLLYALYVDGDTQVAQGLQLEGQPSSPKG